ncbi:MAG: ribose-5-phosphate isomerase RpiA [Spirochaetales bacterium]
MAGDKLNPKQKVGYEAADRLVESGMRIGMGTGSTAMWAIRRIGERVAAGDVKDIVVVVTSSQSESECFRAGLSPTTLADPRVGGILDLVIDGADEVDGSGRLVKGGGAALVREKVVAYAAETVAITVTRDKHVEALGVSFPVPLEVVPFAVPTVSRELARRGYQHTVREGSGKMGPVVTDNGNHLVDVRLDAAVDPTVLEDEFECIPGVVGCGIFARRTFDVFTAESDGSVTRTRAGYLP